jgi:hypothetical protein
MRRPINRLTRFSLRGLLVAITLLACWLGWQAKLVRDQRRAVALVERLGGYVGYDYERIAAERYRKNPPSGPRPPGDHAADLASRPRVPAWLVNLTGLHWWATVERVRLERAALTTADVELLSRLPELTTLNLVECRLRDADLTAWGRLSSLSGIYFQGSDFADDQLGFAAALPRLEFVELNMTVLGDAGLAHFSGLPLRRLDLSETKVTDEGLAHLKGIETLERLYANATSIRGPGLRHLMGLPALRSLQLNQTPIAAEGLEHLAGLPVLAYLDLGGAQVNDEGVRRLAAVSSLEDLGLAETQVEGHTLASLTGLPRLERLRLNATRLADGAVGNLSGMRSLVKLDIPWNNITDAGLAQLVDLPKLKWINVNRTPITDRGLAGLAGLPALTDVVVFDCPNVTAAGVAAFQRVAPSVSVGSNARPAELKP